jgi:hypothetical protein
MFQRIHCNVALATLAPGKQSLPLTTMIIIVGLKEAVRVSILVQADFYWSLISGVRPQTGFD